SDLTRLVASTVETVRRKKFRDDAARLRELVDARGAVGLVVGLPLNMDGSEGPRVQSVRAFARNLAAVVPLPMLLWDERLTTAQAERALLEADTSRKKRAQVIDQTAAAIILQSALDRLRRL
ncbi:MAG: Holliday junction resolvase RuvX, partial [Pseudomonadota bacterium]